MNDQIQSPERFDELLSALAKRGVLVNLLGPALLLAVGYVLRRGGVFSDEPKLAEQVHRVLLYAFGALAISELAVAFLIRRMLFSPLRFAGTAQSFAAFEERCKRNVIVIFAVGASPAVYGFILWALGGTIEQFIFFIIISLIGYRALRPGREWLEKLWTTVSAE